MVLTVGQQTDQALQPESARHTLQLSICRCQQHVPTNSSGALVHCKLDEVPIVVQTWFWRRVSASSTPSIECTSAKTRYTAGKQDGTRKTAPDSSTTQNRPSTAYTGRSTTIGGEHCGNISRASIFFFIQCSTRRVLTGNPELHHIKGSCCHARRKLVGTALFSRSCKQ